MLLRQIGHRHLLAVLFISTVQCTAGMPLLAGDREQADSLVKEYLDSGADAASQRRVVDELRLLGAAGMEGIGRELDRAQTDRETKEGMARFLLLAKAWGATEMVPAKASADWRTIHPEYCFGGRPVVAPTGTVLKIERLDAKRQKELGGVAEEYCLKTGANGQTVRHGPYTHRGPNGEALQQGQYVEGKREGVWINWQISHVQEYTYHDDVLVLKSVRHIGNVRWIVIDFGAAQPQRMVVGCGLGSTTVEISEVTEKSCLLTVGGEIEMGEKAPRHFRVPRKLGKRTFDNETTGLNFSSLESYEKK